MALFRMCRELCSIGDKADNHKYHNGSNFIESIRDQADNQGDNENRNINNHMGNVWYRGCHSCYMGNFGQNSHRPHYLQHGKRQ